MEGLSNGDWSILIIYLAVILAVGWWKGRKESTTEDFVVGGRQVPGWAVLGSIVATEISAITFLNVPGTAFTGDLSYLQFGIGSVLGRVVVATVFLGAFYRGQHLTVYSYLGERFGPRTRYASVGLFLFSRMLGSGLRLSLAAIGMSLIFGFPLVPTLFAFTALSFLYTVFGGIKAIIWTDLIQASVFIGSGFAVVSWLQGQLGWGEIFSLASAAGKTNIFILNTEGGLAAWFTEPNLFFLAAVNGLLATTASLGTDQDLTQRMLTCRNPREAKRSVVLSGLVGIPVAAMFLCLGLGFHALQLSGNASWLSAAMTEEGIAANRVFPAFIAEGAPHLLRGLLVAGVFAAAMSSIDSAMGALSSSLTIDLYQPLLRPNAGDRELVLVSRCSVLLFAVLLFLLAYSFSSEGDHLWLALQIASIPAGTMLGIFLLGLLTRSRGDDRWNLLVMLISLSSSSLLFGLIRGGVIELAWTWLIFIGLVTSFGLGALASTRRTATPA